MSVTNNNMCQNGQLFVEMKRVIKLFKIVDLRQSYFLKNSLLDKDG